MNTEQLTLQRNNRLLVWNVTTDYYGSMPYRQKIKVVLVLSITDIYGSTAVISMYSHVLVLTPQDQGTNQSLLLLGGAVTPESQ